MKLLSITFVVLAIGCSSSVSDPQSEADLMDLNGLLIDQLWILSSFQNTDGIEKSHTNLDDFSFTMLFKEIAQPDETKRSTVEGDFVCNGYAAEFTLEENVLTLLNSETTADSCENSGVKPSIIFNDILLNQGGGTLISINNNQLNLQLGTNEKLVFMGDVVEKD